jgi:hypothetical protein
MVTRQQLHRCAKGPFQKGSLVYVAPAYAKSRERSDHFGSYVRSISLYFYERPFSGLEPMTLWSQDNNFYCCVRAPFQGGNNDYPKKGISLCLDSSWSPQQLYHCIRAPFQGGNNDYPKKGTSLCLDSKATTF